MPEMASAAGFQNKNPPLSSATMMPSAALSMIERSVASLSWARRMAEVCAANARARPIPVAIWALALTARETRSSSPILASFDVSSIAPTSSPRHSRGATSADARPAAASARVAAAMPAASPGRITGAPWTRRSRSGTRSPKNTSRVASLHRPLVPTAWTRVRSLSKSRSAPVETPLASKSTAKISSMEASRSPLRDRVLEMPLRIDSSADKAAHRCDMPMLSAIWRSSCCDTRFPCRCSSAASSSLGAAGSGTPSPRATRSAATNSAMSGVRSTKA